MEVLRLFLFWLEVCEKAVLPTPTELFQASSLSTPFQGPGSNDLLVETLWCASSAQRAGDTKMDTPCP